MENMENIEKENAKVPQETNGSRNSDMSSSDVASNNPKNDASRATSSTLQSASSEPKIPSSSEIAVMASELDSKLDPEKNPIKKINVDQIKNILANFIVPITSLLISALLFFMIILPSVKEMPLLKGTLSEKEALATTLFEKKQKLNTLLDFKSSVEENNLLVSKVLTSEALVPQVLTQVDIMAREAGLTVEKLNYSFDDNSDTEGLTYSAVRIALGTSGSYNQVIAFFENLENSGRLVNVLDVRFGVNEDNNVTTNFVLIAPYVELETKAITDDPISFDINDEKFQGTMDDLKKLKIYEISADQAISIEGLEGVPAEEESAPESEAQSAEEVKTPVPSPEFP